MIGTTPFSLLHPDDVERLAESFLQRVETRRPSGSGALFRVRHRDGSWRWLQGGGMSYSAADGSGRVVCVCRDLTSEILAVEERRRLDEWMQQNRKFECLGVLAGGIAHDFNNLLTPILGEASLALVDLPAHSPLRSRLERIRGAAQRAAVLTGEMLHYGGLGTLELRSMELSELADGLAHLLESTTAGRARLVLELERGLPKVAGDPTTLAQVLRNLVANAAEASPDGGTVVLRTSACTLDRTALARCFLGQSLSEGHFVRVEVEDAGHGMDAETRERLFDPFYSTKFTGRGGGLAAGLGCGRGPGGAIEVRSAPGRGSRVAVLLPARPEDDATTAPGEPRLRSGGGSAKVLVVDDDEAARELAAETLRRAGFVPICVAGSDDALAWLREEAAGVCAVVLAWTPPAAGAGDVLEALRGARPDVPVLLVSGDARAPTATTQGGGRDRALLRKPYLPAELARRVREALGNRVS
jgi:signal transduction histidine kinase/CheY-like chemotaxis protein